MGLPRGLWPRVLLGLLLALLLLAAWWLLRRGRPEAIVELAAAEGGPAIAAAPDPERGPPARTRAGTVDASAPALAAAAPAPLGPAAGDADAGADGPAHPHPITPAHLRIQRENNLIGALNGAMDVNDGVALRGLLEQYRNEFPDDPNLLQEGYRIIADCLQHPGPASTAAGQSYYDRERGSILRRFVARHCLPP